MAIVHNAVLFTVVEELLPVVEDEELALIDLEESLLFAKELLLDASVDADTVVTVVEEPLLFEV